MTDRTFARVSVIDTHTGGEPTRVVVSGGHRVRIRGDRLERRLRGDFKAPTEPGDHGRAVLPCHQVVVEDARLRAWDARPKLD